MYDRQVDNELFDHFIIFEKAQSGVRPSTTDR